jgi:hypothetical protein
MRTTFNRVRLRRTALLLIGMGSSSIVIGAGLFAEHLTRALLTLGACIAGPCSLAAYLTQNMLMLGACLTALPLFAAGLAFWTLSRDRQAGVIVDDKGLLLNLGQSSAFISWSNIERVGITGRPTSMLAFGSRWQLGIALRDVRPYIQSYEERLPAATGPIQHGLRLVQRFFRERRPLGDEELALYLTACRKRTGFEVVIPEALLDRPAAEFAAVIEQRRHPAQRRLERAAVVTT